MCYYYYFISNNATENKVLNFYALLYYDIIYICYTILYNVLVNWDIC